jgi:two-component system, OmpR family, response regulator
MSSNTRREMNGFDELDVAADRLCEPPTQCLRQLSRMECCIGSSVEPRETVLLVGSLELDLIDRVAKRGNRQIDLRPREFRLLRYMMQRSDQLLTRADLFFDVWDYKFVPRSNLVDVHMGRLRRAVDGPNEVPMIRTVHGKGFVLSAAQALSPLLPGLRGLKQRANSNAA